MFRRLSMMAAALLVCLPPGIEGMSLRAIHAGDHVSADRLNLAGPLLGPMDMVIVCGCLTVLCLLNARPRRHRA